MAKHGIIIEAVESITGGLPGEYILEKFKSELIKEPIFKKLFGDDGKRIICNTQTSLNTQIVPMLELRYKTDIAQSQETYISGKIEGRLIFPNTLKDQDLLFRRRVAFLMIRILSDESFGIFEECPGLIEFGVNVNFNYAVAFNVGALNLPGILIDIPYKIDVHKWKIAHPEIDPLEFLDGEEFDLHSYGLSYQVEVNNELQTVMEDSINLEDE